ncbi:hypothetical protein [Profundibacter sp.]|uniref:hypothetical protein n=1 Tax=Profundibacter sp. TaxID=3101071 RepID=UPI003D0B526D
MIKLSGPDMDFDNAYSNSAYIDGADEYPDRWDDAAHDFRSLENAFGRARLNLRYGKGVVSRVWWKFEDGVISGCIEATQPAAGTAKEITP